MKCLINLLIAEKSLKLLRELVLVDIPYIYILQMFELCSIFLDFPPSMSNFFHILLNVFLFFFSCVLINLVG